MIVVLVRCFFFVWLHWLYLVVIVAFVWLWLWIWLCWFGLALALFGRSVWLLLWVWMCRFGSVLACVVVVCLLCSFIIVGFWSCGAVFALFGCLVVLIWFDVGCWLCRIPRLIVLLLLYVCFGFVWFNVGFVGCGCGFVHLVLFGCVYWVYWVVWFDVFVVCVVVGLVVVGLIRRWLSSVVVVVFCWSARFGARSCH